MEYTFIEKNPIAFHHYQEMARLGKFGNFEIMVFENEGYPPHFHFYNKQTGEKGCFKLLEPKSFKHGKHQGELQEKDRKALMEFLSQPPKKQYQKAFAQGLTNYDVLCLLWDMNNDDNICSIKKEIPNYVELEE